MAKKQEFYLKADFNSFTEGPLTEAELMANVASGDLKRSGKISLDNEQFVSIQRVEDILWPSEKGKNKTAGNHKAEPESIYEQIYYRINPHKKKRKKILITRSLATLFKQVALFIRAPKEKRDSQKFKMMLMEHRKQLITLGGLVCVVGVILVMLFYLFPLMSFHSRFESGTAAMSSGDYHGAVSAFREALDVSGYHDNPEAKRGITQAESQIKHKKNRDDYTRLMREGKEAFAAANFRGAKEKFEQAMSLPSFTSDIAASDELAKTLAALKEQDKENEGYRRQYERAILRAEKNYNEAKYQSAEKFYNDALKISGFENDEKAQAGIKKSQDARDAERGKNTEKFKTEIGTGDEFFNAGFYSKATAAYESAMTIPGFDRATEALAGIKKVEDKLAAAAQLYPHLEQQGSAKITDYTGTGGSVTIPDKLSDLPATVIADGAFAGKKIDKLQLGETIKSIGDGAFRDNNIRSVDLPPSLIALGEAAFANNKIEIVSLPKTLRVYSASVFENNALKDLVFPQGVTAIGKRAFANNQLEKIKFPEDLTEIAPDAFYGNRKLAATYPDGSIFKNDGDYELLVRLQRRENGHPKRTLLVRYYGRVSVLKIPAKIGDNPPLDAIGDEAFVGAQLTAVEIPKAIKKIGAKAFAGSPLTEIDLGANVNDIAADAFDDPDFLKFYLESNKRAGKYLHENGRWNKAKVTND